MLAFVPGCRCREEEPPPAISPKQPVEKLLEGLRDPDCQIRIEAALALGRKGDASVRVVSALEQALFDGHSDPDVVGFTIYAIGELGPRAARAVPSLPRSLGKVYQKWPRWREAVLRSLGKLGPAAASDSLPTVLKGFSEPDEDVRAAAACLVSEWGRAGQRGVYSGAFASLRSGLHDPHWSVRGACAEAMACAGPDGRRAVPRLAELLWDESEFTRSKAAKAIADVLSLFPGVDRDASSRDFPGEHEITIQVRRWWENTGSRMPWEQ
jgi:HEAT repeat protein